MNNERALFFANDLACMLDKDSKESFAGYIEEFRNNGVMNYDNGSYRSIPFALACMIAELERDIKTDEITKAAKSKGNGAAMSVKAFARYFKSYVVNQDGTKDGIRMTYVTDGWQWAMTKYMMIAVNQVNETLPIFNPEVHNFDGFADMFERNLGESARFEYRDELPIDDLGTIKGMLKTMKAESKGFKKVGYTYTPAKPKYGGRPSVEIKMLIEAIECLGGEVTAKTNGKDSSPVLLESEYGLAVIMPISRERRDYNTGEKTLTKLGELAMTNENSFGYWHQ